MQKLLGLGSYQTGWTMLHRDRTAMIRPGREVLTGRVEVDETFLGGEQPGVRGRGALGKTLVVVAVELRDPRGYGRARMSVIESAAAATLHKFLVNTVEPGSTVVTDGWAAYPKACRDWFVHEPHPVSGSGHDAHELLPAGCTVSRRCASGGCWAPTKAGCSRSTRSPTSRNSASALTAATPALAGCCSTGSCSSRPARRRQPTGSWWPTPARKRSSRPV